MSLVHLLTGHARRRAAAASIAGSPAAEGLRTSPAATADTEAYVRGDTDNGELLARAVTRYGQVTGRQAG